MSSLGDMASSSACMDATALTDLMFMLKTLSEIVRCGICLEVAVRTVRQCQNGHLLCQNCSRLVRTCPTCGQTILDIRILSVEQVVEVLLFPCRYASSGCQKLFKFHEMEEHYRICAFRQLPCPVAICKWTGFKSEIKAHVIKFHPNSVIAANHQIVRVPMKVGQYSTWCLFNHDEIFKIVFYLDEAKNALLGTTVRYGFSKDIRFRISLNSENIKIIITKLIQPESNVFDHFNDIKSVAYIHIANMLSSLDTTWPLACDVHLDVQVSILNTEEELESEAMAPETAMSCDSTHEPKEQTCAVSSRTEEGEYNTEKTKEQEEQEQEILNNITDLYIDASNFIHEDFNNVNVPKIGRKIEKVLMEIRSVIMKSVHSLSTLMMTRDCDTIYILMQVFCSGVRWDTERMSMIEQDVLRLGMKGEKDRQAVRAWTTAWAMVAAEVLNRGASGALKAVNKNNQWQNQNNMWKLEKKRMATDDVLSLLAGAQRLGGPNAVNKTVRFIASCRPKPLPKPDLTYLAQQAAHIDWSSI